MKAKISLRKILACAAAATVLPLVTPAYAENAAAELYYEICDMTAAEPNGEEGIVLEREVPDGDYTVTIKTGGDTPTDANIYINGGERVRAYTLEAGQTQDNEQPTVPKDGKISVQVLGTNPNLTEIDIVQLPDRTEPAEKPTIYIAGDSTAQTYDYSKVFPQTGWGQVFADFMTDDVIVENRAMGGRSSKSYNNDGRLDRILTEMHPGDYVFIQFGINDGAVNKPERYISVEDYKTLLTDKYIGEVKKRGGIPVLLTASAASWWDEENSVFSESRQDYAVPTKEVAEETGVTLIDINRIMTDEWNAMDKDDVFKLYFICEPLESKAYPTGTDDHTHLKAAGANKTAELIAAALAQTDLDIGRYVKTDTDFTDIAGHWAESDIKELKALKLTDGTGDGKFQPDAAVTRAEFLKAAMDAYSIPAHAYREGECAGCDEMEWYCYYLQSALDKGIIPEEMIGSEKTTVTKTLAEKTEDSDAVTAEIYAYSDENADFKGDTAITREEAAAILINCTDAAGDLPSDSAYAADDKTVPDCGEISAEYRNAVLAAYGLGIIDGDENGAFNPKANLTRAEAAAVSVRAYTLGES